MLTVCLYYICLMHLSDSVWAQVRPHLPKHGPQREAGQRLFFEAVLFVLRQGLSWRALPPHFGHWNTVFVRFNRYAQAGVWERLFAALSPKTTAELQIDSTTIKAHRHASGAAKKKAPKPLDEAGAD